MIQAMFPVKNVIIQIIICVLQQNKSSPYYFVWQVKQRIFTLFVNSVFTSKLMCVNENLSLTFKTKINEHHRQVV